MRVLPGNHVLLPGPGVLSCPGPGSILALALVACEGPAMAHRTTPGPPERGVPARADILPGLYAQQNFTVLGIYAGDWKFHQEL